MPSGTYGPLEGRHRSPARRATDHIERESIESHPHARGELSMLRTRPAPPLLLAKALPAPLAAALWSRWRLAPQLAQDCQRTDKPCWIATPFDTLTANTSSCAALFESQRRPSCRPGDSPKAGPVDRLCTPNSLERPPCSTQQNALPCFLPFDYR